MKYKHFSFTQKKSQSTQDREREKEEKKKLTRFISFFPFFPNLLVLVPPEKNIIFSSYSCSYNCENENFNYLLIRSLII